VRELAMTSKEHLYRFAVVISFLMLLPVILYLLLALQEIKHLKAEVRLLRVLTPGRKEEEIIRWMGNPTRVETNVIVDKKAVAKFMVYGSKHNGIYGAEDIWITLDKDDRLLLVYYPDIPQNRPSIQYP
jgi:hypothetical protein